MAFAKSSALGVAELPHIPTMKSSELRKLAEAAAAENCAPALWDAIAARCGEFADQLHYWDTVHILQSFTAARIENTELFMHLADVLSSKTSKLAPKHVLDLFAVYEAHDLRPRALYVELFHALIRLARSMYAEELSMSFQALARHRIGNPTVITHLVHTVRSQLPEFRLRYLCIVAGALGSLRACPKWLLEEFDGRARFEVETVAVQELLDNLQAFPSLEFSWRPYEELCLDELVSRTRGFKTAADMDQLVSPFDTLYFLQARGLLHEAFFESLIQWCLRGVHRPNTMSERRPTAKQLVTLHDHCCEWGLENTPGLNDAITYYVESGGGKLPVTRPQPLKYAKKRRYFFSPDPLEGRIVKDSASPAVLHSRRAVLEDLPGLPAGPHADDVGTQPPGGGPPPAIRKKLSAPAAGLTAEESTVGCWITSRKGPRPRHRRDPGLQKCKRPDMPRAPLWLKGGGMYLPKYHPGPGAVTTKFPYAGIPLSGRGASKVLRW